MHPGRDRSPTRTGSKRISSDWPQLEELADSFKVVSKAYAIQAGREIRVIVEHDKLDDLASTILASDIAHKIEARCSTRPD